MRQILLGIDPGLRYTGWGIIAQDGQHLQFIASGRIAPNSDLPMIERLMHLSKGMDRIIADFSPVSAAMEETFVNKNPQTSLKLGQARGALMLTVAKHHIELYEHSPTNIKKSIAGRGRADKDQVRAMVSYLLPNAQIESYDAADALAIAICHANHQRALI